LKDTYSPNIDIKTDAIDLIAVMQTLWRGKWLIISFVLICFITANLYVSRVIVPLYPATAKIALKEDQSQGIIDIDSVMSGGPISNLGINTELEILRSREIVGELVDLLELTNQPYFNKNLRKPSNFSRIRYQLLSFIGVISKKSQIIFSAEDVRSSVISSVIKAMKISNTKDTLVIKISITTNDANLSILAANTMAELYIKNQVQIKLNALSSATNLLSSRTLELKAGFEDLKAKMAIFTSQSELVNSEALEAQEIQHRELRIRLFDARERLEKKITMLSTLNLLREEGNLDALISTANTFRLNDVFSQYRNNLMSTEDFKLEIDRFMFGLDAEMERDKNQILTLEASESQLANHIEHQSHELIAFQQLERETEAARLLYESVFKRLLEVNVRLGLETADGRILSKASLIALSKDDKDHILRFSCLIGLLIGGSFTLFREKRFTGYRTAVELDENIGRKVLASVPLIPSEEKSSLIAYLNKKPNSVVSEAIRNLRTSILMSNLEQKPQVIMLTSSISGEGKTIISYALAKNMAGLKKRVLLIEADIRSTKHSIDIDRKKTVSLVDLLTGTLKFKDVNTFVDELGFSVLSGTKSKTNAGDLFASQAFSNLLIELREHFDHIFIDTPPILAVSDAKILGAICDANIYIVKWNHTAREQVHQGLDMFSNVGIGITGLVLNQINPKKMKTYGAKGYYGYGSNVSKYYEN